MFFFFWGGCENSKRLSSNEGIIKKLYSCDRRQIINETFLKKKLNKIKLLIKKLFIIKYRKNKIFFKK